MSRSALISAVTWRDMVRCYLALQGITDVQTFTRPEREHGVGAARSRILFSYAGRAYNLARVFGPAFGPTLRCPGPAIMLAARESCSEIARSLNLATV